MPGQRTRPTTNAVRKRKKHTKSRSGCQNCKLRHVKCDEAKPSCNTCESFRVTCTYDKPSSSLQAFAEGMFLVEDLALANLSATLSPNSQVLTMLNNNLNSNSRPFGFKDSDLKILNRFHERTILSIQISQPKNLYQRESVRLAIQNPFLFHLVLTTTLMHDRLQTPSHTPAVPTSAELHHYATGSSEFNKLLSCPPSTLTTPQKDAIFIGAILLACTSFAQLDANLPPTKIWPFVSGDHDLSWLKISVGKRTIHKLIDISNQSDSSLKEISGGFMLPGAGGNDGAPVAGVDLDSDRELMNRYLPEGLIKLLGLHFEGATPVTNMYYTAAVFIARMMPLDLVTPSDSEGGETNKEVLSSAENLLVCLILISHLPERFMQMLEEKDPRALLLMSYYYGKIAQSGRWWLRTRAVAEGRAVVGYLEVYHGGDIGGLEGLLEFPKRYCFV
ncbi:hypothetical protein QBC44DRAFT_297633 [Cladorrhinum sp. PSN332]|nr:hypothetical protein QBC44DRAFT_297633 [Cladorrhinum sp. PSN332]